jgi:hypothetical protein
MGRQNVMEGSSVGRQNVTEGRDSLVGTWEGKLLGRSGKE